MCSRNSAGSPEVCWMSSSDCSHLWVRCCTSLISASVLLYSQCEATPASAMRFMDCVRIWTSTRSEEHTSELQSQSNLVCRLLLEKKNITKQLNSSIAISYGYIVLIS